MSELHNVNVGIVSVVESILGLMFPYMREDKCRRRTGTSFEHLSETGTNEDS